MAGLSHEQRLHDREEHPEKYCADHADDGLPCLQYRVKGKMKCKMHGGKGGRPVTTGEQTQTARDLWAVPEEVREGYWRALADPERLSLYRHVALLNARIDEVTRKMDDFAPLASWLKATALGELAASCTEVETHESAMQELLQVLRRGGGRQRAWQQIETTTERLRRLTDSERKWNQVSGEMIPAQRVRAVIALMFTSIEKRVSSREERQALVDDLWVFLGIRPEPETSPPALPDGME